MFGLKQSYSLQCLTIRRLSSLFLFDELTWAHNLEVVALMWGVDLRMGVALGLGVVKASHGHGAFW